MLTKRKIIAARMNLTETIIWKYITYRNKRWSKQKSETQYKFISANYTQFEYLAKLLIPIAPEPIVKHDLNIKS